MAEQTQIIIQADPYFREYSISLNDEEVTSSETYLPQNNFLGAFWRTGLGAFCADHKSSGVNLSSENSAVHISHRLLEWYCQTPKNVFSVGNEKYDQNRILAFLSKSMLVTSAEEGKTDVELFVKKLRELRAVLVECQISPLKEFEIKIYKSVQGEEFLQGLLDVSLLPDTMTVRDLCVVLNIKLSLIENFDELMFADGDSSCLAILTNDEKKRFPKPTEGAITKEGAVIFVDSKSENILEIDKSRPTFWFTKDTTCLTELVCHYLDFFYFRFRFQEMWASAVNHLTFKELYKVGAFLSLGIKEPVYLLDARDPGAIVNEKYRAVCKLIKPFGSERDFVVTPMSIKNAVYDHEKSEISCTPTTIQDYTVTFDVGREENSLYVYSETAFNKHDNTYNFVISVASDGCASNIELVPTVKRGTGFVEKRNGGWVATVGATLIFEPRISVPRNGHYKSESDPLRCVVDDEVVDATKAIVAHPKTPGLVEVTIETKKSHLEDVCRVKILPRANAIIVNLGLISKTTGEVCQIEHEIEKTGLNSGDKEGRRVKSVVCFEGSCFQLSTRAVWRFDFDAPIWEKGGDCHLKATNGDVIQFRDGRVCLVAPGSSKLQVFCSGNPELTYEINFICVKDKSIFANKLLRVACAISVITNLLWYGLNFFTFILYCICPISAVWIYYHAEDHLRTSRQRLFLLIASVISIFFFLKAFFEEIA